MAHCTIKVEMIVGMAGISHTVEVTLVAGNAVGCRIRVSTRMARTAVNSQMGADQGKAGLVMIEVGRLPRTGVMAGRTGVTKIVGDMVGISCPIKVGFMAGKALGWGARVATPVAIDAQCPGVNAGQPEGGQVVVEC